MQFMHTVGFLSQFTINNKSKGIRLMKRIFSMLVLSLSGCSVVASVFVEHSYHMIDNDKAVVRYELQMKKDFVQTARK